MSHDIASTVHRLYRELGTVGRIYVNQNNIIHCSCGGSGTKVRREKERKREIDELTYIHINIYMYTHLTRLHICTHCLLTHTFVCRAEEKIKKRESARERNSEGIKRISTPVAQGDCMSYSKRELRARHMAVLVVLTYIFVRPYDKGA